MPVYGACLSPEKKYPWPSNVIWKLSDLTFKYISCHYHESDGISVKQNKTNLCSFRVCLSYKIDNASERRSLFPFIADWDVHVDFESSGFWTGFQILSTSNQALWLRGSLITCHSFLLLSVLLARYDRVDFNYTIGFFSTLW